MSDIAIRVERLSKQYKIGVAAYRHDSLRDHLRDTVTSLFTRNGKGKADEGILWALKDVSFEIKQGEVVGIIGRNGAGKSTLLKILSRITEPTSGRAKVYGRIASLLEVGTGFHAELTGRENIYLNGAILGMKKAEIDRKLDEIIAFAEIEKFMDTPVKRYSSGMYVRLAFAVAAHLEPEILIVDEVLAVGDAAFQKKCLGRMEDVAKTGRTVIFVSHNLGALLQLCPQAILLNEGRLVAAGASKEVSERYFSIMFPSDHAERQRPSVERKPDDRLRFTDTYLRSREGHVTTTPIAGDPIDIIIEFESFEDLPHVRFMLTIFNQQMIAVTHCNVSAYGQSLYVSQGKGQVSCHIPRLPLPCGSYKIAIAAEDDRGDLDWVPSACFFNVEASNFFPSAFITPIEYSAALVDHSWKLQGQL